MKLSPPVPYYESASRLSDLSCGLGRDLIEALPQRTNTHRYTKKQIIYYEGTPALGVYCIQSGEVKVYKSGPEGKLHILQIAHPGDVLCLESFFVGDVYSTTAEMMSDGDISFIEKTVLMALARKEPPITMKITQYLAEQLVKSEEERVELAQASVRERISRLLGLFSRSHGIPAWNGIRINLPFSREEMAEMVGTATETAMRLLKEMKDEKIIEVHGKEIIVLDPDKLAKNAHLAS